MHTHTHTCMHTHTHMYAHIHTHTYIYNTHTQTQQQQPQKQFCYAICHRTRKLQKPTRHIHGQALKCKIWNAYNAPIKYYFSTWQFYFSLKLGRLYTFKQQRWEDEGTKFCTLKLPILWVLVIPRAFGFQVRQHTIHKHTPEQRAELPEDSRLYDHELH